MSAIEDVLSLGSFDGIEVADLEQVVDEAGKFARDVIAPTNEVGDQQGVSLEDGKVNVPDAIADLHAQFVANGWQSVAGDPEFDGMGLPSAVGNAVSEMIETGNLAYSLLPMLTHDGAIALEAHGTDEQKQKYLSKLVTGEWSGTMLLTEPQAGSDLAAVKTRAVRDGDRYRIFGTKIFITWGDHELSENIIHFVLARVEGAPEGVRGISMFIVPKFDVGEDGELGARNDLRATSLEHKLGIHASPTCVMSFGDEDGAVGYLLGEENKGLANMFTMMNHARLGVGLQGLAVSERAYQLARAYAHDRVQGKTPGIEGRAPIVHHADVRRMLMLMRSQIEAMRAVTYTAAAQIDHSHHGPTDEARAAAETRLSLLTPIVKGWCTEKSEEITSLGVQIHGGMGYVEETGAAQHYRDARILTIYEGTSGIQANDFAGRKTLGDEGRELGRLIAELREMAKELGDNPALEDVARAVSDSLDLLEQGGQWIVANAMSHPSALGAASFNYMMLAGTVLGGAYLAKAAGIASSGASDVDQDFAAEKRATAAFYSAHVLPRALGYLAAMTANPEITMALPAEAFGA
jgi:alkylation response protein AidB-like acyl-CoA dehydrogenase